MMSDLILINAEHWCAKQKRITNKSLRERFDLDEEAADAIYKELKDKGIIGRMGYVEAYRG